MKLLNTTVTFKLHFGCGPYSGLANFFRKENKWLLCLSVTAVGCTSFNKAALHRTRTTASIYNIRLLIPRRAVPVARPRRRPDMTQLYFFVDILVCLKQCELRESACLLPYSRVRGYQICTYRSFIKNTKRN